MNTHSFNLAWKNGLVLVYSGEKSQPHKFNYYEKHFENSSNFITKYNIKYSGNELGLGLIMKTSLSLINYSLNEERTLQNLNNKDDSRFLKVNNEQ